MRIAERGTAATPKRSVRRPRAGSSPHRRNDGASRTAASHRRQPEPPTGPLGIRARDRRNTEADHRSRVPRDGPGSVPVFRVLLHARVRHSHAGGLDRHAARSSPGLLSLQGVPPHCGGPAFTAPPLMGFSNGARTLRLAALQGLDHSEVGWSLARLPALLGFIAS
jgi:hypothetical protein